MSDPADTRVSLAGLGLLQGIAKATVAGGNDVLVDVGGIEVTAHTLRAASVTADDPVLIGRQGAVYWVFGPTNTAPPPPPPIPEPEDAPTPPPPKPVTRTGKLVVSPVETRSYRDGKWRTDDDTYQGQYGGSGNYTGVAFYGQKPSSLDGATCTAAYVKLRREKGSGDYGARRITLWAATQKTRPGGNVTRTYDAGGPALAVNETTSFHLPTVVGQDFIDGNIGSLACYDDDGDNYLRLSGRGSWSAAWSLTLHWRRTS